MTTLRQKLEQWAEREAEKHAAQVWRMEPYGAESDSAKDFKAGASSTFPMVEMLAAALTDLRKQTENPEGNRFCACILSVYCWACMIRDKTKEPLAELEKFLEASDGK